MRKGASDPATAKRQRELLTEFTPLAKSIAGLYQRKFRNTIPKDDIFAAAMVGLWQCILRQPRLDHENFRMYATPRIRGAIVDEMRAHDWLPRRLRRKAKFGGAVPKFIRCGDHADPLLDSVDDREGVDSLIEQKELIDSVKRAVDELRQSHRDVLKRVYQDDVTQDAIAKERGISAPRVCQLHKLAIDRLKESIPKMRLAELSPEFVCREKSACGYRYVDWMSQAQGLVFDCPKCGTGDILIWFTDFQVSGTGIPSLGLSPDVRHACGWKARVRDGNVFEK